MGRHVTYNLEQLTEAVANSYSIAQVMRHLGIKPAGGSHSAISRRIKRIGLDTSHFRGAGWNRGGTSPTRLAAADILVVRPPGSARAKPHLLRRALLEMNVPYECVLCSLGPTWNTAPITLHVDHIDGNPLDCRIENLRFVCPNCHSQTASWAGRNRWLNPEKGTA